MNHPYHPATLSNLATAMFVSCQANGTYLGLNIPISLFEEALNIRPTGHPDRPVTQLHLAIALLSRFVKRGFQADADAAGELLNEVRDASLADSHIYRAALLAIEISALARSTDADTPTAEGPIPSTLPWSPNELARRTELCFHTDDPHAVDELISLHYDALGYYSTAHDQRGQLMCNLGTLLSTRFQRRGNSQDLDEAVALLRQVLDLQPVGHPDRAGTLFSLATKVYIRFEHRGNDSDLDEAIPLHREALALLPVGHPDRCTSLDNLVAGLSARFEHRGNDQDLDEALVLQREALALRPVGHPSRFELLNNLATVLSTRFQHRGNDQDLDEAIVHQRGALALFPVGHPRRFMSFHNLAHQLFLRYQQRGNDQDLDEAIPLQRMALALLPVGHIFQSRLLNNLANQLSTRFEHRGNVQDLGEALPLQREALALLPVGHPLRSSSLNNLASLLSIHFTHRGNVQDLDESIALQREALALFVVGHPLRSGSLNNLAGRLSTRFKHRGNDQDLDEAIVLDKEALALLSVGHPHRPISLDNLAHHLSTRFEHRGNDQDLDEAIPLHREALALLSVGHSRRSISLNHLANQLSTRFKHRANDQDLDEALLLQREALALCPVGHADRCGLLNNLSSLLCTRFERRGNDQDLDEAIPLHREALALRPVGHPDRSGSLNNLAAQLTTRFEHRGNDLDLDEAIALHREALSLRPVGHPDRCHSLRNLSIVLSTRFEHRGNNKDLNESLENIRCALTLLTQHDPRHLIVHWSLADVYLLFHRSGLDSTGELQGEDTDSLNAAMRHLEAASNVVSGGFLLRLRASLYWLHHANQHTHCTELEAYATSIQLLDTYMSATASVTSRHDTMKVFPRTLAVDAASCALRRGDVCRAVELLEQGRTLIWTQMARLHTPLDSLKERGDHAEALMKKFRDLSSLLDKSAVNHPEGTPRVDVEAEDARYRHIMKNWNKSVEGIRKFEGFDRFLLPPLCSDLQVAARDGPIIVLVASKSSCDAIIIPHEQPPISIRLPTSLEYLVRLVNVLRETVETEVGPKGTQPGLIKALRDLWEYVVRPVVEILGRFARRGSRIWWCQTTIFNFLPLHAAGEYKRGGKSLSQLYVSSYTPSLTALIRARKRNDGFPSISFAAIGQNHPPGHSHPLEAVEPELELVHSLLPPPPIVFFTKVTSTESIKSRVLHTLQDNHWLHFACHGTQNLEEPFKSAFLMRDQPLSLLDITQTYLSRHEFAFLSACETAVGDSTTPDEVIHLAAGLQFVGVKSVIGTLWRVMMLLCDAWWKNSTRTFAGIAQWIQKELPEHCTERSSP
ncbi:CHAT domain-containing protein [Suillus paluster]|uniref:CHAT domain-containing protein n=1 Tax=Suillus paluster TaxID=48578 RepID=UPI001B87C96D|nr:CHAT domain-containing protein [Suillus paluster]KAG1739402.1 CHAT domain-containing protein [Suillus paluster]